MNLQDRFIKIHAQYGTSEKANYELQKLFDQCNQNKVLDVVKELNEEMYHNHGCEDNPFVYETDGYYELITFSGYHLWDSENDEREFIHELNRYEALKTFIKKMYNEFVDYNSKFKFKL